MIQETIKRLKARAAQMLTGAVTMPGATGLTSAKNDGPTGARRGRIVMTLIAALLMAMTAQTARVQYATSGTYNSGNIQWNLNTVTKTLTFTFTGSDPDMSKIPNMSSGGDVPWNKTSVEKLVIGSGITRIGNQIFKGHVNLNEVEFQAGSQLTEIGSQAFNACWKSRARLTPEGKAALTPENLFVLTPVKS